MILGLGQDEEPVEDGAEEPADGVVTIQPYPYPVTEPYPYPYPVYYQVPDQQGLRIGGSTVPQWVLVLGVGLLAGYVVGGRA